MTASRAGAGAGASVVPRVTGTARRRRGAVRAGPGRPRKGLLGATRRCGKTRWARRPSVVDAACRPEPSRIARTTTQTPVTQASASAHPASTSEGWYQRASTNAAPAASSAGPPRSTTRNRIAGARMASPATTAIVVPAVPLGNVWPVPSGVSRGVTNTSSRSRPRAAPPPTATAQKSASRRRPSRKSQSRTTPPAVRAAMPANDAKPFVSVAGAHCWRNAIVSESHPKGSRSRTSSASATNKVSGPRKQRMMSGTRPRGRTSGKVMTRA